MPATFVNIMARASASQPSNTASYVLVARDHLSENSMVMVYLLSAAGMFFFACLMLVSIHRSVMAARKEALEDRDIYKSDSVFLKLARCIWGGVVIIFWAFLALFTKNFWKHSWAGLRFLLSPYSWLGVFVNAYTCGYLCNADPEYDPELAGFHRRQKNMKEASDIVSQQPKLNRPVAVPETSLPKPPARVIIIDEV